VTAFDPGVRVHVVGVGGAGMSGLARLLVEAGAVVSGSDLADSAVLEGLRTLGVSVAVGHDATNASNADVVLWSPAVASDNVELVAGRAGGALLLSRAEVLADLARVRPLIGTDRHARQDTATSMMVHVMAAEGRDADDSSAPTCSASAPTVTGAGATSWWKLTRATAPLPSCTVTTPGTAQCRGRPPRPLRHAGRSRAPSPAHRLCAPDPLSGPVTRPP